MKNTLKAFCFFLSFTLLLACNDHKHIGEKEIVVETTDIGAAAAEIIENTLEDAMANNGHLANFRLNHTEAIRYIYQQHGYAPLWSIQGSYTQQSNTLFATISQAKQYGLFPSDYHADKIRQLRDLLNGDTTAREKKLDASEWAKADLLLTSAFVHMVKDLKKGRLLPDSVLARDSTLTGSFYMEQLQAFQQQLNPDQFAAALEPKHPHFLELKAALRNHLAQTASLTKEQTDREQLHRAVYQQLLLEDSIKFTTTHPDSVQLSEAILKYQRLNGLVQDGKVSDELLTSFQKKNDNRFVRIAVTLDKYKLLPEQLPQQFIWVNIPAYRLELWDSGFIQLTSKVVVGKPETRTPELTSAISHMITYPQWHIPQSIIKKEILPGLKSDSDYLARKGYSLIDKNGNTVDPHSINWSRYTDIPFKVIQGSGDENALGVLKFNFPNDYSVYLHDTNQRYLFSKKKRALSHGCVRVEAWENLAHYILQNDSSSKNAVPVDSLQTWLYRKQKHVVPVRKRIPLYIRYFTCNAADGNIVFYDDVYGEDRKLEEQFFSKK